MPLCTNKSLNAFSGWFLILIGWSSEERDFLANPKTWKVLLLTNLVPRVLSYQSLRSERQVWERTWERGWLLTSPRLPLLLLTIPSHLSQVIEISGVSEHLLTECESSDKFAQCPRCKEAIPKEDLDEHFAEKSCQGKFTFSLGVLALSVWYHSAAAIMPSPFISNAKEGISQMTIIIW